MSIEHKSLVQLLVLYTVKVECSFVGENEWHLLQQTLCASTFAVCTNGLVKSTPSKVAHINVGETEKHLCAKHKPILCVTM